MALNEHQLGQRVLIAPTTSPCDDIMWACFKGSEPPQKVVAISAYLSNDRLARQRSGFTIHGMPDDLRTMAPGGALRSISIPAESKRMVLRMIEYMGITRTSLFHDLDALAEELREQYGIS